ncbi:hypothetical protein [Paenibacillus polymyxa]|uniref:hypothetical protein n=1 Tax=Paenibacillus polymyxa TaxID=1406 RepID=UPI0025B70AF0|nr:hypothetical protein [Paenibacillus polymyxa]MDN4090938.1 hypothetical protein [Paenibacillus polymyxa]
MNMVKIFNMIIAAFCVLMIASLFYLMGHLEQFSAVQRWVIVGIDLVIALILNAFRKLING